MAAIAPASKDTELMWTNKLVKTFLDYCILAEEFG